MHKIKLILLLILPLSVLGQDLGIIDTKTTKNPAINGTHRISTDGKNLFFRNFFGLSKKVASTDSAVFTGTTVLPSNTTIGNVSATELGYLDGVTSPIQAQLDGKFGLSLNNTATGNNVFTGNNTFFTPIFANTTSTNAFSKITGIWSGGVNNNIASFSLQYETRFGGNSIIRNPLNFDYNGWVGIGITAPTTALDVSGGIKATSSITALNLNSYSTTLLATNVGGNVGIGLGSPTSKLHVAGTGRITGALILDNTVSGLLRADASGNITSDATAYLSSSTAASTYAPITSPTFITDATTPRLKITGAGDIGKGSDLVMAGNSNDLTMHGTGKVILGTGGFQRLVVTNAGNVGVGTTAPVAKFEVSGLAGFRYNDGKQADGKYLRSNSTGVAAWDSVKVSEVFGLNTTYLPINNPTATGTLTAPTISNSLGANFATTSGNVGVGTASPSTLLHLKNTTGNEQISIDDNTVRSTIQQSSLMFINAGVNLVGGTSIAFRRGSSYAESMRIFANGRVGINTTTDAGYLTDINGTLRTVNDAYFATTSGNVGIGTTTPVQKLDVNGGQRIYNLGDATLNLESTSTSTSQSSYVKYIRSTTGSARTYWTGVGIQGAGDDAFRIYDANAGVNRLNIFANGNIGVGTTTDAGYKLDVNGDINIPQTSNYKIAGNPFLQRNISFWNYIYDFSNNVALQLGGTSDPVNYSNNTQHIFRSRAGSEYMRIDANGRLGIGTTAPSQKLHVIGNTSIIGNIGVGTSSPSYRLSVYNSTSGTSLDGIDISINDATAGVTHSTKLFTQQQGSGAGRTLLYAASNITGVTQGQLDILTENGGNFIAQLGTGYGGTNSLALYDLAGVVKNNINTNGNSFFNGGNVGIGTTTPSYKLDIQGSGIVTQRILSTDNQVNFSLQGTFGQLSNEVGDFYINNNSASGNMLFRVGSTVERMRISSTGNVGIGTTTDAGYKLDVNGSLRTVNDTYLSTTAVSNVGIGTTTPSQKLDVDGNIKAFSVSGGGAYYSSTTATDAAARNWVMRGNSVVYGDFDIRQSNALNGDPIAAGNSRFYINPNGNVGIGTASPNASSVLDITSTTQGVLFPRLTTTQISAIASPADGLTVYNTTLKAICFYDSSAAVWKKVSHSNM